MWHDESSTAKLFYSNILFKLCSTHERKSCFDQFQKQFSQRKIGLSTYSSRDRLDARFIIILCLSLHFLLIKKFPLFFHVNIYCRFESKLFSLSSICRACFNIYIYLKHYHVLKITFKIVL